MFTKSINETDDYRLPLLWQLVDFGFQLWNARDCTVSRRNSGHMKHAPIIQTADSTMRRKREK